MNLYPDEPPFQHGELPAIGLLLANLGTPEAPTPEALRPYLRQFLMDPRVVEESRLKWWLILNLFVLTRRPRESATLYRKIWTEEGSPLLAISRRQRDALQRGLQRDEGPQLHVELGMRYGKPSIADGLRELKRKGCRRLLFLPLYPQYSATTTASTFDALCTELTGWRYVPELRTIHQYHDDPGYIASLCASIREVWSDEGPPQRLLFSFHGIPLRYFESGDPYHCLCHKTARLVAEELELPRERYEVAFQSQFGKEEWIKPTTDVTVRAMARSGIESLDVICPGFSADCLETLEEIDELNREIFLENGGSRFRYIPCLNDRRDHIRALSDLVERNLAGWRVGAEEWASRQKEAALQRELAESLRASPPPADAGYGTA